MSDVYLQWDIPPVPGLSHPYVTAMPDEMWDQFQNDAEMLRNLRITIIDYVQDMTGERLDPEALRYTLVAGPERMDEEPTA